MTPSSLLTLTVLLLALPLSARADEKADASAARVARLAAEAAARVKSGQVAEIYGERTRNDAGAGVDPNGPRGTRSDANLPGSQLPMNLRGNLPAPPRPAGPKGGGSSPGILETAVDYYSGLATRAMHWWSPPEPPVGKLVENPGFERAKCANGQPPPCPMEVMVMGENTPHAVRVTDLVDYGEINGDVFVQPRWWEFWKEAKPNSDEVSQGGVGDCFLMASLAALSVKDPDVLKKMIRMHKKTQATWVSFYEDGKPVLVGPVDNLYPVYKPGVKQNGKDIGGQSAFAQTIGGPPPPKWPLIIEKAYTIKFRKNSYGDLNMGGHPSDAMTAITGRSSQWFVVDKKEPQFKSELDFSEILKWDLAGQPIIIGTKHKPNGGCKTPTVGPPTAAQTAAEAAAAAGGELTDSICTDPLYDRDNCTADSKDPVCKGADKAVLAGGHAYWIRKVDAANKTVTLANPWGAHTATITWPWTRIQKSLYVVYVNDKK